MLEPSTKEERVITNKDLKDLGLDTTIVSDVHFNEFIDLCWVDPFLLENSKPQKKDKDSPGKTLLAKDLD